MRVANVLDRNIICVEDVLLLPNANHCGQPHFTEQGRPMRITHFALVAGASAMLGCAGTHVKQVKFKCEPPRNGTVAQSAKSNPLAVHCSNGSDTRFSGVDDDGVDGIRYYESAPFLLVHSDGKGGLTSQVIYLPDLTKKRVIQPYAYFASNNSTLTFVNGVLTQGKVVADETLVPKAVIGVLEAAAKAALGGSLDEAGAPSTPPQHPPPYLFKINLSNGGAKLIGGPGRDVNGKVRMIDVTVTKKPEAATPGGN